MKFQVPVCSLCGAYLPNGPCEIDAMTTATIMREIWELEQWDAINGALDHGRVSSGQEIAQLNTHLAHRFKELANV